MKKRFIKLVSDTTFKYLWKKENTRQWLVEIIKEKTGIDLSNYRITNNEFNTGDNLKDYRTDITLTDEINKIVIIEMQDRYSKSAMIKALLYLFRSTGILFEEGGDYNEESTTTLIMFNNFYNRQDKKNKLITHEFKAIEIEHKYDLVKSYEIYLPAYYNLKYKELSRIDKRLYLFRCKSYEEMHNIIDNEKDKKILEELERLGMNRRFVCEYDREKVNKKLMNSLKREGYIEGQRIGEIRGQKIGEIRGQKIGEIRGQKIGKIRGQKIGEKKGEMIGKRKQQERTIKEMLKENFKVEVISRILKIPQEQVKKYQN
jgi:hypothetical protein